MVDRLGQYELLEKFAEGGMAEVWFGRVVGAEGFTREVAVKRMLAASARDADAVSMFLDEARLGARLHHPNICSVLDLGELDGEWFMVMELVDGPHLGRLFAHSLRIGKPLPLPLCAAVVAAAAEGLHHAHDRVDPLTGRSLDIIHRDVSPQNILISRYGDVKVTDFGVARARTHKSRTRSGLVKGKLGYLSPEQCRGLPLDRRADVFSLGIVLYELLTRRRLYRGDGEFDVMRRICEEEPLPPSLVSAEIDGNLGDITLRALRKEPEARYQTAGELADALTAWLQAHHPGDLRGELGYWVRSHTGAIWPPLEQRQLRWREREGDGVLSVDEVREQVAIPVLRNALPKMAGVFIGRRAELRLLEEDEARLRVLVGLAGVGKSRLALRHAESCAMRGERVVWVDLGGVDRIDGATTSIARALAIDANAGQDEVEARLGRILARDETLLVLDNADGVADALGRVLGRWLTRAASLRCLVTSRKRLRWQGEATLEVEPLSLPEGSALAGSEAAMLLLSRARSARAGFRVEPEQRETVAEIVRLLDGLPLALELAAARLDRIEVDRLLEQLRRGGGDLAAHFTAAMDDLPEPLVTVLRRVSTFAGPFETLAAEAVAGIDQGERDGMLERLEALLDRSLLRRHGGAGLARYEVLPSLRSAVLAAAPEAEVAASRDRHAAWVEETATQLVQRLDRHGGGEALRRLQRIQPELEVVARDGAGSAAQAARIALAELFQRMGPRSRVEAILGPSASAAGGDGDHARARLLLARCHLADGNVAEARRLAERAAASPGHAPEALALLSTAALRQERREEARAFVDRAYAALRALDEPDDLAGVVLLADAEARAAADDPGAGDAADRAIDALRAIGDAHREAAAVLLRATIALYRPEASALDLAATLAGDALELAERGTDGVRAFEARILLTTVAILRGELQEAALSIGAAQAVVDRVGSGPARAELAWLALVAALMRGESAVGLATRATELAQQAGGRHGILRACCWQVVALHNAGEQEAASLALDHAEGWGMRANDPQLEWARRAVGQGAAEPEPDSPSARLLRRVVLGAAPSAGP